MENNPRPMRLTERDIRILEAIHAFDGMLGAFQIQRMFFKSWRTTRERLSKLYQNGYINRPDRMQRAAITQMIYWLSEKGVAIVAGLQGKELTEFKWRREPKWSMVEHDLSLNDFRLTVMAACSNTHGLELEEWRPQSEFWAYPDSVEYYDEHHKKTTRKVRPDGYCVIRQFNDADGQWYRYRLLCELDMATEDNFRVSREKVLPGVAYLNSGSYEQRFGAKSGRWLFVTTGERRMMNMKRQTEAAAGRDASLFAFTVLRYVQPETVLTEPIWLFGNEEEPRPLFDIS